MEQRKLTVGQVVKFVDAVGVPHDALVQQIWDGWENGSQGCNLVYVVSDESRTDQYGRQTEHSTSVCHRSSQPAPGMFWCWPDELK